MVATAVGAAVAVGTTAYSSSQQRKAAKKVASASDPNNLPNIRLPGFDYAEDAPVVDMPEYPTMPILPNDMPTLRQPKLASATYGEQSMGRNLAQAEAANLSLLNPNSSVFRNLAAEEEQLGNQDFLKGVRSLMTANQRAKGRGGAVFDQERGGEQIMNAILNNARDSNLQARLRARGMLGDASNRFIQTASGFGQQANLETGRRNNFREDLQTRIGQLRQDASTRNNQQRTDMLGAYDAKTNNIVNALNLYRNNQAQISQAAATQANFARQDQAAMMQGVKDLGGLASNYYSNNSGAAQSFGGGSPAISGFQYGWNSGPSATSQSATPIQGLPWLNS